MPDPGAPDARRFPTPLYVDECLKTAHPHLVTDPIMRRMIAEEVHKWIGLVEADARARLAAAEAALREIAKGDELAVNCVENMKAIAVRALGAGPAEPPAPAGGTG